MALTDILHRLGQMIGLYGEEEPYEDLEQEDEYEQEEWQEEVPVRVASSRGGVGSTASYSRPKTKNTRPGASYDDAPQTRRPARDNVVQMPQRGEQVQQASGPRHSAIIVYVRRKEDAQQIISYILEGRSVILNCEEIDDAQCQRVIDMLGGAAFALGGRIQRVSHCNYLFVPANVELVSGETSASRQA